MKKQLIKELLAMGLFDQYTPDEYASGYGYLEKYDNGYFLVIAEKNARAIMEDLKYGDFTIEKDLDCLPTYPAKAAQRFSEQLQLAYRRLVRHHPSWAVDD
ncbi:hypothetical protein [Limosilactobacillus kribbianus]|uniref:hypothetical protein n=1 Tax=Limosilactobacillus kribbianus TaxID=2982695 RepID=UPI002264C038|nr:hypothetical protein [Limosilactobacillus kribbianus]